MPTILRNGPYRFFFYASDGGEPVHVHVEREAKVAKYWLSPIRLQDGGGFTHLELRRIRVIIAGMEEEFMEAWYDYFGR